MSEDFAVGLLRAKLAEDNVVLPIGTQSRVEAAVAAAVDQIEDDRASANVRSGEMHDRALAAEKRNVELREALMRLRERADRVVKGEPVRDMDETFGEVDRVLKDQREVERP